MIIYAHLESEDAYKGGAARKPSIIRHVSAPARGPKSISLRKLTPENCAFLTSLGLKLVKKKKTRTVK